MLACAYLKKPHTRAEEPILSAAADTVREVANQSAATGLRTAPVLHSSQEGQAAAAWRSEWMNLRTTSPASKSERLKTLLDSETQKLKSGALQYLAILLPFLRSYFPRQAKQAVACAQQGTIALITCAKGQLHITQDCRDHS